MTKGLTDVVERGGFLAISETRRDGGLGEERSGWVGDTMMELWVLKKRLCWEDYCASYMICGKED